jgi:hypothetical protein
MRDLTSSKSFEIKIEFFGCEKKNNKEEKENL